MIWACFYFPYLLISSYFTAKKHNTAHNIHNTQPHTHSHTHAHLPLTVILRVDWVRVTRGKTRENAWKRQSQGNLWRRLVAMLTGKSFVCGEVATDQSNHLVPSEVFPHSQEKSAWLEESGTCCSRPVLKLQMGKILWTSGEPLEQVMTLRGPFMVNRKLAMKDEPHIELRCCSRWAKITIFLDEKCEVLSRETVFLWIGPLFRRIGPPVSLIRTFSKTNAPIPKKHPVWFRPEVDFESSRSPATSESSNKPNRQCWTVFLTWQYCL